MSDGRRPGRYLRIMLLVGFGGLLVLLLAAGAEGLHVLDMAHEQERLARDRFLSRNAILLRLDTNLDGYGSLVQRTVSAHQRAQAEAIVKLRTLSSEIQAALDSYPPDRQPQERALLEVFEAVLTDQEKMLTRALADDSVWEEVLPAHRRMVAASEQLAAWNQSQLSGMDGDLLTEFGRLRTRLKELLSILLGSGLILAMGSIVYIAGQEREIRQRYSQLAQSRDAQEELSSRLLDAQEQERRSISRELHDEVGQSLSALLVDVGRMSAMLPPGDERLHEYARNIKAVAERSVASVRDIALLLRPSMLDDLGLAAALEWQAREVSRRSEVEVEVEADSIPDELSEECKICIYRLTQEALNNVARHSRARHAWVRVRAGDGTIGVSIRDDGHGFDPERAKGLGILGMEERVRRLRGSFRTESRPGEGTTISAELPVTLSKA